MRIKIGRTYHRGREHSATIRHVEGVRMSSDSPIDTVRLMMEPTDGVTDHTVRITFDRDAISLNPDLASKVDQLIDVLSRMRSGALGGSK